MSAGTWIQFSIFFIVIEGMRHTIQPAENGCEKSDCNRPTFEDITSRAREEATVPEVRVPY